MIRSALIYGHSQAEPTGMGDDLVAALKAAGVQVSRVGRHGKNDKQLLALAPDLGDVSVYDRVFLFCGGNSDKPQWQNTRKLIQYFGASRVIAILPPINTSRNADIVAAARERRRANTEGIADLVRVYAIDAGGDEFKGDEVHMRPGTPTSKALAARLVAEMEGGSSTPWVLAVGLGSAIAWWWIRRRS